MSEDRTIEKENFVRRITEKIFGGLTMSWSVVFLFALATAVITTVFLVFPVFKDTSFEKMGETMEAWVLFAVIIMANCKKPLESALKVFVFFLVSQPLIYLFQVPFSYMGWELFMYYGYWFVLTLLTFPGAFIGWFINKKNYMSAVIFLPVMFLLLLTGYGAFTDAINAFPHMIVTALFCLFQIVLYCYVFLPGIKKRAVALVVPVIVLMVMTAVNPQVDIAASIVLPGDPVFSGEAEVRVDDTELVNIQLQDSESGTVYITAGSLVVFVEKPFYYFGG